MKLGLTIEPYQGISAGNLLSFAHAITLDHVEINVNSIPDIKGIIENLGKLTTTFHLPIWGVEKYDLGSKRKEHEKDIKKVITFINKYHKDLIMLFTLSHPPESKDSDLNLLMENLQQIDTKIVLENIPWQKDEQFLEFYNTAKDILGDQIAGHCMDAAHRFLTDNDNWLNVPKVLLDETVYIHLQDSSKDFDDHLPLGQGEMPFNDFLLLHKNCGFTGVINQEIKPKGLDLESIMDSCLLCVKPFSRLRYTTLRMRYAILRPILRKKINQAAKNAKKA